MTFSTLSPVLPSSPVPPDDDSCFDRTVSPSPVFPKETLQQCGVSRVIQIWPIGKQRGLDTQALIHFLEQAARLGYNAINIDGLEPFLYSGLERLVSATHSLGYTNSVTTNGSLLQSQRAQRILRHLDLVTIGIEGKQEAHDKLHKHEGAFAQLLEGLAVLNHSIEKFGLTHTLLPDSWQILSWLTDFAIHHKASCLHLRSHKLSNDTDLYRAYISHGYLKAFSTPELIIRLDLLHRDNIIATPNFPSLFNELVIDEAGDILPIASCCSKFFRIGNIHSGISLNEMLNCFKKEKFHTLIQLYNETYREVLTNKRSSEIVNWNQMIVKNSHSFQTA